MNYRTILLATAAVMFAGAAQRGRHYCPDVPAGRGKGIVKHFPAV